MRGRSADRKGPAQSDPRKQQAMKARSAQAAEADSAEDDEETGEEEKKRLQKVEGDLEDPGELCHFSVFCTGIGPNTIYHRHP